MFAGHQEKPNIVVFHPQAKSVLVSAGYDCRLLVWDVSKPIVSIILDQLSAPVRCVVLCCVVLCCVVLCCVVLCCVVLCCVVLCRVVKVTLPLCWLV